jgi:hypothetical protein
MKIAKLSEAPLFFKRGVGGEFKRINFSINDYQIPYGQRKQTSIDNGFAFVVSMMFIPFIRTCTCTCAGA